MFEQYDLEKLYLEDKNLIKDDVRRLMKWIDKHPNLPQATEFQALTFLHSTYYDLESAKAAAESYFTLRTLYAYLFDPMIDEENVIRDTLSAVFMKVLPEKTPDGCIIMLFRIIDLRPCRFDLINVKKIADMILMSHLHNYGICNGLVIVYDMTGVSFRHVMKINLRVVKHFVNYLQNGFPLRLKQVHFLNASTVTQTLINIAKPFLRKKILDMMVCHKGDNRTIYDYIRPELLPREMCGTGPSLAELQEGHVENLIQSKVLFKWLQKQKILISK